MRTLKKNKPLKGMSILLFLTFMGFARLMAQFYCGMDKIWQKHLGKSDGLLMFKIFGADGMYQLVV